MSLLLQRFDLNGYRDGDEKTRSSIVNSFIMSEFTRLFGFQWTTIEQFNLIVSQDKRVRKWYKELRNEIKNITDSPKYSITDEVPASVRSIVLNDLRMIDMHNKAHNAATKIVVDRYKTEMEKLDLENKKFFSNISLYSRVAAITIDDIPLEKKRLLFSVKDATNAVLIRKDLVHNYKLECFKNLVANDGKFSNDFDDPFRPL